MDTQAWADGAPNGADVQTFDNWRSASPLTDQSGSTENEWESVGFPTPGSGPFKPLPSQELVDFKSEDCILPPGSGISLAENQRRSLLGEKSRQDEEDPQKCLALSPFLKGKTAPTGWKGGDAKWFERLQVFYDNDVERIVDILFDSLVDRHNLVGDQRPVIKRTRELNFIFFELFCRLGDTPSLQLKILDRLCQLVSCNESSLALCVKENLAERLLSCLFACGGTSIPEWDLNKMVTSVRERMLLFLVSLGKYSFSRASLASIFKPLREWHRIDRDGRMKGLFGIGLIEMEE
uniref:Uncharacterized protein n=1 Tax=Mucochytrium quahogii TaxID=96639 RepID=A0A7S2S645_9STRA|mmetsp:Transcript_25344/g.54677  ORF Transcript_25344/g.54677 Transcript_25344/m.54677 type:complete len:293 (+) Transcript_25344:90-968(+)